MSLPRGLCLKYGVNAPNPCLVLKPTANFTEQSVLNVWDRVILTASAPTLKASNCPLCIPSIGLPLSVLMPLQVFPCESFIIYGI